MKITLIIFLLLRNVLSKIPSLNDYCKLDQRNTPCYYKCERAKRCGRTSDAFKTLTDQERQVLLDIHNKYRNAVANGSHHIRGRTLPPASNMHVLSYDKETEFMAACWSKQCHREHDKVRKTLDGERLGQNVYAISTTGKNFVFNNKELRNAVGAWFNEIPDVDVFHVPTFINQYEFAVPHFSQIVWADTKYVGCAKIHIGGDLWQNHLLFCNYKPAGNIAGRNLYNMTFGLACEANDEYSHLCGKIRTIAHDTFSPPFDLDGTATIRTNVFIFIIMGFCCLLSRLSSL